MRKYGISIKVPNITETKAQSLFCDTTVIQIHPLALLSFQDDVNDACWPNFLANFDIKIITSLTPSYWAIFGVFRNIVHIRTVRRMLVLFYDT